MLANLARAEAWPTEGGHDVCVCGSGPAGMTVARELSARGARVLLLEAGGVWTTDESNAIYAASSIGPLKHWGVSSCRLRQFGGTSGHWQGRCAVLDDIDFEPRDIWGMQGWPIARAEAYSRLADAKVILDIDDQSLDRRDEPLWRDARLVPSGYARSAPTRFASKYGAELKASRSIDVVLNANVVDVTFNDDRNAVAALTVSDYRGRRFSVSAKYFVMAFGSLENARFLLNISDSAGFPFGGAMAGRCFMEHFEVMLGRFVPFDSPLWRRQGPLSLTIAAARAKQLGSGNAVVSLAKNADQRHYGRLASIKNIRNEMKCATERDSPEKDAGRHRLCHGDGAATSIIEQAPNPSSRVVLDRTAKDQFGQARLAVDWRLAPQDVHTIRAVAEETGKALAEQDVARFQMAESVLAGHPYVGFHCHQMGTTRMSTDRTHGVVDADLKVHGMKNFYIAGSSVFPTAGCANPTVTLTALALRLGEHLAARLARR